MAYRKPCSVFKIGLFRQEFYLHAPTRSLFRTVDTAAVRTFTSHFARHDVCFIRPKSQGLLDKEDVFSRWESRLRSLLPPPSSPLPSIRPFTSPSQPFHHLVYLESPSHIPTIVSPLNLSKMQPTLTLFSILLTLSTFSHASRLAPAKRSNLAPRRQNCPPLSPSEKIITKKEIVDGNQECVPDPSSKPSTQPFSSAAASAFAAAESATTTTTTVSVAEALEAAHNRNGISAGALVPANPDPCGPPTGQAPGAAAGSLSTCRANVSVANLGQPSAYGVQCANDGSGYTLEQTTCADSSITICDQISGLFGAEYQRTNTWIWSTQDGNCTFGYW